MAKSKQVPQVGKKRAGRSPKEIWTKRYRRELDALLEIKTRTAEKVAKGEAHREAERKARAEISNDKGISILTLRRGEKLMELLESMEHLVSSWQLLARVKPAETDPHDPSRAIGIQLLTDLKAVFDAKQVNEISSEVLVATLLTSGSADWTTCNHGNPLSPRLLALKLGKFGIKPRSVRPDSTQKRGYRLEQFREAFERYVKRTTSVTKASE